MARVTRLPRLLCALGVTAVALGGVSQYVTRALFDPDQFASRAASSLRDPRVSAFVATEISDAAIRERCLPGEAPKSLPIGPKGNRRLWLRLPITGVLVRDRSDHG